MKRKFRGDVMAPVTNQGEAIAPDQRPDGQGDVKKPRPIVPLKHGRAADEHHEYFPKHQDILQRNGD